MGFDDVFRFMIVLLVMLAIFSTVLVVEKQADKISILQTEIESMATKIEDTNNNVSAYRKDIEVLQGEILQLQNKVERYEQDMLFWNEQVDSMFGEHNARYFKEGRDK